jgi:hypothetical protein
MESVVADDEVGGNDRNADVAEVRSYYILDKLPICASQVFSSTKQPQPSYFVVAQKAPCTRTVIWGACTAQDVDEIPQESLVASPLSSLVLAHTMHLSIYRTSG